MPFIGYSDETSLSIGGQNFHPILTTLALPGKLSRGRYAHHRVVLLPVIARANLGPGKKDPRYAPLLAMVWTLAVGQLMAALPRHGCCCCVGNCQACSWMMWMIWSLLAFLLQGPRPAGRHIQESILGGREGPEGSLILVSTQSERASAPVDAAVRLCLAKDIQRFGTLLAPKFDQSSKPSCGASCSPQTFQVEGCLLRMLVLPVLWIVDLKEAWHICGLRSGSTYFPDITYMVPRGKLTEATKNYPPRDINANRKVRGAHLPLLASCCDCLSTPLRLGVAIYLQQHGYV